MNPWNVIAIRDQHGALMVDNKRRVRTYRTEAQAEKYARKALGQEPFTILHMKLRQEWANG